MWGLTFSCNRGRPASGQEVEATREPSGCCELRRMRRERSPKASEFAPDLRGPKLKFPSDLISGDGVRFLASSGSTSVSIRTRAGFIVSTSIASGRDSPEPCGDMIARLILPRKDLWVLDLMVKKGRKKGAKCLRLLRNSKREYKRRIRAK
jgi:hypothetical protein